MARCPYHNTQHFRISLFNDYQAGIEQLPTQPHQACGHLPFPLLPWFPLNVPTCMFCIALLLRMPAACVGCTGMDRPSEGLGRSLLPDQAGPCAQVLENHRDEVWHVQFSHSGTMLASASKDASALVWRVTPAGEAILMHTLAGHAKPVVFLAWSPDDCRLLTCCSGQEVRPAVRLAHAASWGSCMPLDWRVLRTGQSGAALHPPVCVLQASMCTDCSCGIRAWDSCDIFPIMRLGMHVRAGAAVERGQRGVRADGEAAAQHRLQRRLAARQPPLRAGHRRQVPA